MAHLILGVLVFNAGFLVGVWWGSGWGRSQRDALKAELMRLRHESSGQRVG